MSGEGGASLGVRTIRGDFERALVADVIRALQATGVHELTAGNLLKLVPIEDGVGRTFAQVSVTGRMPQGRV